jgi:multidrug efflux pump subunit AcrA (membrane-fusion protein)
VLLGGAALIVAALAGGTYAATGASPAPAAPSATPRPTATATVTRKTLSAKTKVSGTLGFEGSTTISNALATLGAADPGAAAQAVSQALAAYNAAVNARDALLHPSTAQIAAARAQLAQVRVTLASAQDALRGATPAQLAQARAALAAAQAQLASAKDSTKGPTDQQIAAAQAQVAQAKAQLASATAAMSGPTAAQLAQARATVSQAEAAVAAAEDALEGPSAAAIAQAQAAVTQAKAALAADELALVNVQNQWPTCQKPDCDPDQLAVTQAQAQGRVESDKASLAAAEANLAELTSPAKSTQAQANLTAAQAALDSAKHAYDALTEPSTAQQRANVTAAEQGLRSAEAALAALTAPVASAGAAAQLQSARDGVAAAAASLSALQHPDSRSARAGLAAALAQVDSAEAALGALLHPTATQVKAAKDAVSAARAELDAARAKVGLPRGIVTSVAAEGSVVHPGGVLYTLDGSVPVVLLTGSTPAWRTLAPGMTDGVDVRQLEENFVALGFAHASLKPDEHWDDATTDAVRAWQRSIGLAESGSIPIGQVVFRPTGLRVTSTSVETGDSVTASTPVLEATSDRRAVSVDLSTAQAPDVHVGDAVDIVLPDGVTTTTGRVRAISDIAKAGANGGAATIAVTIDLDMPSAVGSLDQAPVSVRITTSTAKDVLAVPVQALVALLEGGYAVEVVDGLGSRYVGVKVGLFADGWVQVSGSGLEAGQKVAVPR